MALPPSEASAPRWKSGPIDTPPYGTPSSTSVQTWPVRSTANACVTDTIRRRAAMRAGWHTSSTGRNVNLSSASTRSYSRRVPMAQLATIGPVTTRECSRSTTGSVRTLEWIASPRRLVRCVSIEFGTRPRPTCRVAPSSTNRAT